MGAVVTAIAAVLLKPNVGVDVLGTFDPKANDVVFAFVVIGIPIVDGTEAVVFAVAPNVNMDGVPVPSEPGTVLTTLEFGLDVIPKPIVVLAANVGFITELPKVNVGGAEAV